MKTTENQLNITEEQIKKLPPYKKHMVEALLKGESQNSIALRISIEKNSSLIIAKAYVKVVAESFQNEMKIEKEPPGIKQTPFDRLIEQALINGEAVDELILRLSKEMDIPKESIRGFVKNVQNFSSSYTK